LKLTISKENVKLLQQLQDRGLFNKRDKPLCFNFDFSLLAIEEKKAVEGEDDAVAPETPTLIGVDF
jgi:hypothetical protein